VQQNETVNTESRRMAEASNILFCGGGRGTGSEGLFFQKLKALSARHSDKGIMK
jgi:hypothetical protein